LLASIKTTLLGQNVTFPSNALLLLTIKGDSEKFSIFIKAHLKDVCVSPFFFTTSMKQFILYVFTAIFTVSFVTSQTCGDISNEGERCLTTSDCPVAGNCKEGLRCMHSTGGGCPLVAFPNCSCQKY
jgi:hypothetical protein